MSKTVTIIAITSAQQSAIAASFAEAGWAVGGTSRSASTTPHGPTVIADPDTGDGLVAAFVGSDVVVLSLPQDHRPGAMPRIAENVAKAAEMAGVQRLVLNTAGTIAEDSTEPLFIDMRAARDAICSRTVPWVILQPTVYMDNLLAPWSLPSIVERGVLAYPAPEAASISWISHRSLAAYACAAATHPDAVGRDLRIGGPDAVTGSELSALLSQQVGRPVTYQRIPLDGFAAGLDQQFGPPAGQRIASLYARLDAEAAAMAVDPTLTAFLGVEPESFSAFAARQDWSSRPS